MVVLGDGAGGGVVMCPRKEEGEDVGKVRGRRRVLIGEGDVVCPKAKGEGEEVGRARE